MNGWTIRRAMWGSLVIWIGVMMVIDEAPGVASIGAGAILLLGALFKRAYGLRAGFVLTMVALLLLGLGLGDLGGEDNGIPLVATALIAFGAMMLVKAFGPRRPGSDVIRIERHRL